MEKKLMLRRIFLDEEYTIGKLYLNGVYVCDTLEDKVRDLNHNGKFDNDEKKVYGKTAIPYGNYKVTITYSNRFKKLMPLINNVPEFEGVRIHSGNTAADTLGCILVGENKEKGKVVNSRAAYNRIMLMITQKDNITIEIV